MPIHYTFKVKLKIASSPLTRKQMKHWLDFKKWQRKARSEPRYRRLESLGIVVAEGSTASSFGGSADLNFLSDLVI